MITKINIIKSRASMGFLDGTRGRNDIHNTNKREEEKTWKTHKQTMNNLK